MPFIPPVRVTVERAGDGTLSSVDVRVHSYTAHDSIQLRVVHSTPTGGDSVVYTTQVSTGASDVVVPERRRSGATGPTGGRLVATGASGRVRYCFNMGSTWSGTLVPSDWNGGCQSQRGTTGCSARRLPQRRRSRATPSDAGPTGESGPTGAAGCDGLGAARA